MVSSGHDISIQEGASLQIIHPSSVHRLTDIAPLSNNPPPAKSKKDRFSHLVGQSEEDKLVSWVKVRMRMKISEIWMNVNEWMNEASWTKEWISKERECVSSDKWSLGWGWLAWLGLSAHTLYFRCFDSVELTTDHTLHHTYSWVRSSSYYWV